MEKNKLKYRYNFVKKEDIIYPTFTQPSMSFTPRQIIEQFASGEIIAQENHPTDEFYDDKFTEDQLMALHIINDDFQLRQYVLDFYNNHKDEQENVDPGADVSGSSSQTSDNSDEPGQPSDHAEQN